VPDLTDVPDRSAGAAGSTRPAVSAPPARSDHGGHDRASTHALRLPAGSRLLLLVVALVVYGASPVVQNTDSYLTVPTAQSLLTDGDFDLGDLDAPLVADHYGITTDDDGAPVSIYPWTGSLPHLPAIVAVDAAHALSIGPGTTELIEDDAMGGLQLATASALTALVVMLVGMLAFERLSGDVRRRRFLAIAIALVFAFGTGAWSTTSRALWQHAPVLLALAIATLMAQRLALEPDATRSNRRAVVMGAALAYAYTVRPTSALAFVALTGWIVWQRRTRLGALLGGAAAVVLPWFVVNAVAFGTLLPPYHRGKLPQSTGQASFALHADYLEALAANLVSPARGLLVHTPLVVLAVFGLVLTPRTLRPLDRVLAACVVAHLLVISGLRSGWWGGFSYGARYWSDMLVFLTLLAVPAVDRLAAAWRTRPRAASTRVAAATCVTALVVGVAMSSQGALSKATLCWNDRWEDEATVDEEPSRIWSWTDPQFLAGIETLTDTGSLREATVGRCEKATAVGTR